MQRLKGKSILIGKEPGQGRLLVSVAIDGQARTAVIGQPGTVPNSVSRCKPAEGTAHCKVDIDQNGIMVLTNLKPQNVTYVNGIEIASKRVQATSEVALGKDRFQIPFSTIIEVVKKIASHTDGGTETQSLSIAHLEKVWNGYEAEMERIAHRQQEIGRRRMLPIMIGSASGLASPLLATLVAVNTLYVTVPIAAISFGLYFINYRQKDTSYEDRKAAQDKLIDEYVCPYPDCHRFLGNQPFKVLRQVKKCPFCGKPFKL